MDPVVMMMNELDTDNIPVRHDVSCPNCGGTGAYILNHGEDNRDVLRCIYCGYIAEKALAHEVLIDALYAPIEALVVRPLSFLKRRCFDD